MVLSFSFPGAFFRSVKPERDWRLTVLIWEETGALLC